VYFDDFKVEHIKSPVVSSQDYYPFGLTFNSYQRENSVLSQYQYSGKEIQDELAIGELDYGWRFLRADIGRFNKPDIFSSVSSSSSPYAYAENDPTNATDLGGNFKFPAEFRQQFPRVTAYLEKNLPLMQYNETIVNSLSKFTNMDTRTIKNELQNGDGPSINARDFDQLHWGNNSVAGRIDVNEKHLLQKLEDGLASDDPKHEEYTTAYAFMTIITILHEYVHEASKRNDFSYMSGWDNHDEGSHWEFDVFKRYNDFIDEKQANDYGKAGRNLSVESFMRADPSMGVYAVIYTPSAPTESPKKKKDADKRAAKRSGGW
jgi:RHS repeat-associated protein